MNNSTAKQRYELLVDFLATIKEIENPNANQDELRSKINRKLVIVRQVVEDAGLPTHVDVRQFGQITSHDLFLSMFGSVQGVSVYDYRMDTIERAIGYYEGVESGVITSNPKEIIDIEGAIQRALRPSFSKKEPGSEKEVQDQIGTILSSVGITFTREAETAPVGARTFIPDFAIEELSLALEVKLATTKHSPSKVQEEIMADVSAYKTKWRHVLFVVYDLGVITDPYKMREDTMKKSGVTVLIVKH